MLILSRKKSEVVKLYVRPNKTGKQIQVTVVDVRGDKVRIGFDADKDTTIHRAEIADLIGHEDLSKFVPNEHSDPAQLVLAIVDMLSHLKAAEAVALLGQASQIIYETSKSGGLNDQTGSA